MTGPLIKDLSVLLEVGHTGGQAYGLCISRRTGLKSGTLYPILDRLEDAGWVQSRWEESEPSRAGRPRRRFYRLTSAGAHEARATLAEHGVSGTVRWTWSLRLALYGLSRATADGVTDRTWIEYAAAVRDTLGRVRMGAYWSAMVVELLARYSRLWTMRRRCGCGAGCKGWRVRARTSQGGTGRGSTQCLVAALRHLPGVAVIEQLVRES